MIGISTTFVASVIIFHEGSDRPRGGSNDLNAFRNFIDEQLATGTASTVDEVLARWDSENETAEERGATVQALKEALADMDAGDAGIPVQEALAELRRKHHLV